MPLTQQRHLPVKYLITRESLSQSVNEHLQLTHFKVLIEKTKLTEVLQIIILLPAAVQTLWVAASTPAAPPVLQPATHRHMTLFHASIYCDLRLLNNN